jgi:DNA-binding transcriptional LysR family regulator
MSFHSLTNRQGLRTLCGMNNPVDMIVFAKVVELGSFSAAADHLQMSASVVSKHVSRLEHSLGVRLLNRTTRRLSLTEVGAAVFEHGARMSAEANAGQLVASQFASEARGLLRIGAASAFGRLYVAPAIPEFLRLHPDLSIEMSMSDRLVDFVKERFDLAIGADVIPGANLVARKLAAIRWVVCASEEYLARHGTPRTPADLERHNCVFYRSSVTAGDVWRFQTGSTEIAINVRGRYLVNNSEAVWEATRMGVGVGLLPTFAIGSDIGTGSLRLLLTDYEPVGTFGSHIWLQYVAGPFVSPKIRACVDYFTERFRRDLYWDRV